MNWFYRYPSKFKEQFKYLIFSILTIITFVYLFIGKQNSILFTLFKIENEKLFLVNTSKCKIPDLNPFNNEAKQFFIKLEYKPCTNLPPLTYITKNNNTATLYINNKIAPFYSEETIQCCYSKIWRLRKRNNPDDYIRMSKCLDFKEKVEIDGEFMYVKCRTNDFENIYENTHASLIIKPSIKKLNLKNDGKKPYNVLLLGIDSVSRLNLIRTLPKTYKFLLDNNWISLKGYNKIDDNTFPNFMAFLTGYNISEALKICKPNIIGGFDSCPFIWKKYKQFGYTTGYAEDEVKYNTFNLWKKGFDNQPTDYYFRPLFIASEKMERIVQLNGLTYCLGPESSGEKIMNLAKDFLTTLKNYPNWGLFWMNTFSHNNVNGPGMMDEKIRDFFYSILDVYNDTIVFFLSDHGMRFGNIRYTYTGWLEERLPFLFVSVPKRFQNEYPKEYSNLKSNSNKLTTPFDLYITLQHILQLSGLNHVIKPSSSCPNCKSLFTNVGNDRKCEDVGILPHWCTCFGYSKNGLLNQTVVDNAQQFLLKNLLNITKEHKECVEFSIKELRSISVSEPSVLHSKKMFLLLIVEMVPFAIFEATVSYEKKKGDLVLDLEGSISRLDFYDSKSKCVTDGRLKKYCHCK